VQVRWDTSDTERAEKIYIFFPNRSLGDGTFHIYRNHKSQEVMSVTMYNI
jgi:hypothetical protein